MKQILRSLAELGEAFGMKDEPETPEVAREAVAAVVVEEKSVPSREEWARVPDDYVAIDIHKFVVPFEVHLWREVRPTETVIAFPKDEAGFYGDPMYVASETIRRTTIELYGWEIVEGLVPTERYFMAGGFSIVLPYEGRKLVPPPGLWMCDTPARVKAGEIKIDDSWKSIFDLNRGKLAWGPKENGREGWNTYRDAYPYVRIGGETWHFHKSLPGFGEMVTKMYGDKADVIWQSQRNSLVVKVPRGHSKYWIGAGGRTAQRIAEKLGLAHFEVKSTE